MWAVPGKSDDLAEVRSSHAPRPPRNRPWESLASAAAWRSPLGGDREHEQMGGEHRSDISAAVNGNLVTIKTTGNICMKWRQKGGLLRAGPPGPAPLRGSRSPRAGDAWGAGGGRTELLEESEARVLRGSFGNSCEADGRHAAGRSAGPREGVAREGAQGQLSVSPPDHRLCPGTPSEGPDSCLVIPLKQDYVPPGKKDFLRNDS